MNFIKQMLLGLAAVSTLSAGCAAGLPTQRPLPSEAAIASLAPAGEGVAGKAQRRVEVVRLGGQEPHLSAVAREWSRGQQPAATYRLCVDTQGRVNAVTPVSRIPGDDEAIQAALRTWTYKPQGIPFCFALSLKFLS